jgi:hypothetical protein
MFIATIGPVAPSSKAFLDTPEYNDIVKYGILACPTDVVSLASIKISVTCLLLRLQQSRIGKIFLYVLMAVIIISHVSYFLFVLLHCKPVAAGWNYTIQGKCASQQVIGNVSNAINAITIATDIILSLFPITILRQIRKPLMEKVLIGVLMAMGLAASATSVYKLVLVKEWVSANDTFGFGFQVAMLTCSELFIGITAACLPCLKPVVQRWLESMGVSFKPKAPQSFLESEHGNGIPDGVPSGPLQEFNTHTGGTTKTDVFNFSEMEDLSRGSSNLGGEGSGSGSEQERSLSRSSYSNHIPRDDVV